MKIETKIKEAQNEDGSFSDASGQASLFHTALALFFLNDLNESEQLREIKKKAAEYILLQKDKDWQISSCVALNFLALSALMKYDGKLMDGKAMASILTTLSAIECKEGGPYYSYIGRSLTSGNADLGVNVAVACFLSVYGVQLPSLNELVENAIIRRSFNSEFFSAPIILQLIFPWYNGEKKESLMEIICKSTENQLIYRENDQEFLSTPILDILFNALKSQRLEKKGDPKNNEVDSVAEEENLMVSRILQIAEERFSVLEEELRDHAIQEIKRTIGRNPDKQMTLMAYFMRKALGEKGKIFSDDFIATLGLANVFFWTAFIIYDDFWDEDEAANPKILPAANLYARDFTSIFSLILPVDSGFGEFFREIMDKLDAANTWETSHCRMKINGTKIFIPEAMPDYGNFEKKYAPASAHVLGSIVMLYQLGYTLDSSEVKNLIDYFKNYLIPKQINDDLHDWQEDLKRGHISTVVAMLLKDFGCDKKTIDLETDLEDLQKVFWFKTLPKAGVIALDFISRARKALDAMESLEDKPFLEQYILQEERVLQTALDEQKKSVEFLAAYEK